MAITYQVLTEDEKDETIVNFMRAQERDHYCHTINLQRYNDMIATLPEESAFKARVMTLRDETVSRLDEVTSIISASLPQLPTKARIDAALLRIKAKEEPAPVS